VADESEKNFGVSVELIVHGYAGKSNIRNQPLCFFPRRTFLLPVAVTAHLPVLTARCPHWESSG
jgi:hypothetical protein